MGKANEEAGCDAVEMLRQTLNGLSKITDNLDDHVSSEIAVDVELRLKGLMIEKSGRLALFRNRKMKESEIELNLATHVIIRKKASS